MTWKGGTHCTGAGNRVVEDTIASRSTELAGVGDKTQSVAEGERGLQSGTVSTH